LIADGDHESRSVPFDQMTMPDNAAIDDALAVALAAVVESDSSNTLSVDQVRSCCRDYLGFAIRLDPTAVSSSRDFGMDFACDDASRPAVFVLQLFSPESVAFYCGRCAREDLPRIRKVVERYVESGRIAELHDGIRDVSKQPLARIEFPLDSVRSWATV
jgi:hypothetical protein